jgi:uncharacterized membrane protein (GlpM family)
MAFAYVIRSHLSESFLLSSAGVIMLHLGFDLVNDSVVASRRALDALEYSSIIIVGSIVTIFGFVPGEE